MLVGEHVERVLRAVLDGMSILSMSSSRRRIVDGDAPRTGRRAPRAAAVIS